MVSRRGFLAGLAAVTAGCSDRTGRSDGRGPTVTAAPVPETTPVTVGVEESRFGPSTPAPEGVSLFHQLESDDTPTVVAVPSRELFTPEATTGQLSVQNVGSEPLFVSIDWRLMKFTGHRWLEILSPQVGRAGINPIDPGERWARSHRIERVFGLATLGPGLYARLETARFQGSSDRQPPVGALFEVAGTTFEFDPARPATIEDGVARVRFSDASSELVFERTEAEDPTELVPEAVGAIPVFRDSIPYLEEAPEVRLRTASASVAAEDIGLTTARDVAVEPGEPLQVGSKTFTLRVEES